MIARSSLITGGRQQMWIYSVTGAILPLPFLGVTSGPGLARDASETPSLKSARWVNSPPLTAEALRGKVVLVDFWKSELAFVDVSVERR